MKFSIGFRNSVLKKVLPPESRIVLSVGKEFGISAVTIKSWLSKLKDGTLDIEKKDIYRAGEP